MDSDILMPSPAPAPRLSRGPLRTPRAAPSGSPGRAFLRLDSDIFLAKSSPAPRLSRAPSVPPGRPPRGHPGGPPSAGPRKTFRVQPRTSSVSGAPLFSAEGRGLPRDPLSLRRLTPPSAEGRQRASSPVSRRPVGDSRHPTRGGFRPSRGADKSSSQRQSLSGSQ